MASFNRVILLGNLTRDPQLRYLASGTAVAEIGLAVNHRRQDQNGQWIDEPCFVDVTLWGRQAETASEYLSKGSPVLIEGRLKMDNWETTDGQKRSKLKVVAEQMRLVGGRAGAGGGNAGEGGPSRGAARPAAARGGAPNRSAPPPEEYVDAPPVESGGDDIPF